MRIIIAAALALLVAAPARAQKYSGAEALDFLNLDANARAVALGGAYTALASDSNALLYNPAGLGRLNHHELTLMHNQFLEGANQQYVGLATRQGFGASLNYLKFGDIPRTRVDAPNGTIGQFGLTDLAFSAGYGRSFFGKALSAGGALKYLREDTDGVSASGTAFDAGVLAAPPSLPALTLGLSLMNAGPGIKHYSETSPLPTALRAGAAWAFKPIGPPTVVSFDLTKQRYDKARFGLGAETTLAGIMALRAGFNTRNDAGIGVTGGFGFVITRMSVDYAFAPYGDLGLAHRVSLTFRWGIPENPAAEPWRRSVRDNRRKAAEELAKPRPRETAAAGETVEQRLARVDRLILASRYEQANKELETIGLMLNKVDRRRVRWLERRGAVAQAQGGCERAKAHYIEAIKSAATLGFSDPAVAESYSGIGQCLLDEGNTPYAKRFFQKALEASPSESTRVSVEAQLRALQK